MGVSTDGEISYGILLGENEDGELPWDTFEDIEEWWLMDVMKFKPSVELYDSDGGYIGGVRPDAAIISAYYDEKFAFKKANPIPVELTNACSGDYPVWILGLAGKGMVANRGYPVVFDPTALTVTNEEKTMLLDFCTTHGIDIGDEQPKWYLSSYYG